MKKAIIIYHSKTGITKNYGEQIGQYLKAKSVDVRAASIQEYRQEMLEGVDYVLLGCWTSGLFVVMQHPEPEWNDFAEKLPYMSGTKPALFTTYKILTGSMFRNMNRILAGRFTTVPLEFKSRNGMLSENDKKALDKFIA